MVEENNNEMAMEDILSSIKDILEEDEQNKSGSEVKDDTSPSDDVVADVLNSSDDIDDILELSPDMRVDNATSNEITLPPSLSEPVNAETPEPIAELPSEQTEDTSAGLGIGMEATDTDSFFGEDSLLAQDDTLELPDYVSETLNETESVSPFADEAENLSTPLADETQAEDYVSMPEESVLEQDTNSEIIEAQYQPVEDMVLNDTLPEPEEAISIDADSTTMDDMHEENIVEQPTDVSSETAIDASANIISNFAKMFSREEETIASPQADVAPVISAGRVDQTLEDLVVEAITRAIGNEINRQWNDGADFKEFAEKAIVEETKKWLNNNLPQMVEKIVKQEIERVMAKVGSKQA